VTAVVYRQQVAKQARQRASQPAKSLNGFRGVANTAASRAAHLRASDPSSSDGVAKRVQIALLRLTPGVRAARRRAGTCSWLAAPTARFRARRATKGVCDKQVWLTAIGTAHWRYRLRRHLPPGRYVLYSRVIDAVGNATEGFSARLGNRQAFRLT
jgi:hypothetical protein